MVIFQKLLWTVLYPKLCYKVTALFVYFYNHYQVEVNGKGINIAL